MTFRTAYLLLVAVVCVVASQALANGETVITQAKVVAGNVTPGDTPGFPLTLSQPGAYVFESNLTVPAGIYGILITANNVDLDMNGFLLTGSGRGTYGIISGFGGSRIHDGVIKSFKESGIYLRGNSWDIGDMQILRNGAYGIDALNARFIKVQNSLVLRNSSSGVLTGQDGVFRNNTVAVNGPYGIWCSDNCHAEGNLVDNNTTGIQFFSGMALGNAIARNTSLGLNDGGAIDTGLASNMFIDNNAGGTEQIAGGTDVHVNTCIGSPC